MYWYSESTIVSLSHYKFTNTTDLVITSSNITTYRSLQGIHDIKGSIYDQYKASASRQPKLG